MTAKSNAFKADLDFKNDTSLIWTFEFILLSVGSPFDGYTTRFSYVGRKERTYVRSASTVSLRTGWKYNFTAQIQSLGSSLHVRCVWTHLVTNNTGRSNERLPALLTPRATILQSATRMSVGELFRKIASFWALSKPNKNKQKMESDLDYDAEGLCWSAVGK